MLNITARFFYIPTIVNPYAHLLKAPSTPVPSASPAPSDLPSLEPSGLPSTSNFPSFDPSPEPSGLPSTSNFPSFDPTVFPSAVPTVPPEDRFNYRETEGNDYGPADWSKVGCDDHATCPGWPDDFETYNPYIPYNETENTCMDCSAKTKGACRRHKQSPLHLYRNVTAKRECHDRHWMHSSKGTCSYDGVKWSLERHGLRVTQPLDENGQNTCDTPASIDFSMGFPNRWNLVHTDIKVPSEHMQDGKRYAAEVQLAHIYSKKKHDRLIANVAIFLEAGNETDSYNHLKRYIRLWQQEDKLVRQSCQQRKLGVFSDSDGDDEQKRLLRSSSRNGLDEQDTDDEFHDSDEVERRLGASFPAYHWLKTVDTEYYFRYEGSQGVPPCHEVVHWRVMKEPIKVAPSQIDQLENLIKDRLDPVTCERDTAGRKRQDGSDKVDVNRPIQLTTHKHKLVFCECVDWESKKPGDLEWCKLPMEQRGVMPRIVPTKAPSSTPSQVPSGMPSISNVPSESTAPSGTPSESNAPSGSTSPSSAPSSVPSASTSPSGSRSPSPAPSQQPSHFV